MSISDRGTHRQVGQTLAVALLAGLSHLLLGVADANAQNIMRFDFEVDTPCSHVGAVLVGSTGGSLTTVTPGAPDTFTFAPAGVCNVPLITGTFTTASTASGTLQVSSSDAQACGCTYSTTVTWSTTPPGPPPAPTFTTVTPSAGPDLTQVTVNGSHFNANTLWSGTTSQGFAFGLHTSALVKIGGQTAAAAVNQTAIVATAPQHATGVVDIQVINSPNGISGTLPNAFTYVLAAPVITTQPASQTITSGTSATLNVGATGTALNYQWYRGTYPDTTTPVGINNASLLTGPLTTATNYWVRVSNAQGPPVDSATATISVGVMPPAITTQPTSQTITSGTRGFLRVATTGTAPFTYQWYQGLSGDTSTPVGTNSANFRSGPPLTTETSYWVRVSNAYGLPADSTTGTISIGVPPAIGTQPASQSISPGTTATLNVGATGTDLLSYQWYQGASPDTTTPVGTNSPSFTTPALMTTTSYWVRVSNGYKPQVDSAAAIVNVDGSPRITAQPQSQTLVSGATATLNVVATGTAPLNYQWYQGTSPHTTFPVGANSSSFTTPPLTATTNYWVRVSNAYAPAADSTTATISVGNSSTELLQNGDFNSANHWTPFATPDLSYVATLMVTPVADSPLTNGLLAFYRRPPPEGTTNEAGVFQETGAALPALAPLRAQFSLSNGTSLRKRISVALVDHDFSDVSFCTFWLAPRSPFRTYQMRTHTTQAWDNAAIYFYAETAGIDEYYLLDNVSLQYDPDGSAARTDCVDPTTPAAPGGSDGPTLLTNGDFATGLPPWTATGSITSQVSGGVLEFVHPAATPAAVVEQNTGQAISSGQILSAQLRLGNSSSVRKRVTVQLRDLDATDLVACVFWLPPGLPLSNYAVRGFASQAWASATLSVSPDTVGNEAWIRLDDVAFQLTPGAAIVGTECIEPGAGPAFKTQIGNPSLGTEIGRAPSAPVVSLGRTSSIAAAAPAPGTTFASPVAEAPQADGLAVSPRAPSLDQGGWETIAADAGTVSLDRMAPIDLREVTEAWLSFQSRLSTRASWAEVQARTAGGDWLTLGVIQPSAASEPVDVDLGALSGEVIEVQFVIHTIEALDGEALDAWQVDDLRLDVSTP